MCDAAGARIPEKAPERDRRGRTKEGRTNMDSGGDYIRLEDVTKVYKMGEVEIRAVDGISFGIDKGEFVVVVGPSGAGKTTVLIFWAGWIRPLRGKCWWTGRILPGTVRKSLPDTAEMTSGLSFSFTTWCPI